MYKRQVVPLLEQISSVAEVEAMGGKSEYYKIELQSDEMAQYQVTMNDVSTCLLYTSEDRGRQRRYLNSIRDKAYQIKELSDKLF